MERHLTITNAVLRRAGALKMAGSGSPSTTWEVSETETRTQAAVALLVDTSFSMVMENRWLPMKRTRAGPQPSRQHPVPLRRPLQIIAFWPLRAYGERRRAHRARGCTSRGPICTTRWPWPVGICAATPTRKTVVLIVTDGEPTAHLEDFDGSGSSSVFFDYPPPPEPSRTRCGP